MKRWTNFMILLLGLVLGGLETSFAAPSKTPAATLDQTTQENILALKPLYGATLSSEDLQGKIVIITFFASWCPPCREEFIAFKKFYKQYHQHGVEIVAINWFEDFEGFSDSKRLKAFLKRFDPPFPVVAGNKKVSQLFGTIRRIPSLFIYDQNGQSSFKFIHNRGQQSSLSFTELETIISPLL